MDNPSGLGLPAKLQGGALSAYVIRSARAPGGSSRKREGVSRAPFEQQGAACPRPPLTLWPLRRDTRQAIDDGPRDPF